MKTTMSMTVLGCVAALFAIASSALAGTLTGSGAWESKRFDTKGSWNADLARAGDDVSGGISLAGSPVFSGGSVTGMIVDGCTITFGVVEDGKQLATFTGTLDGTTVTGTYESAVDSGVWSGTLQ